jgi:transcriptional regulator of arginine metabolism
MKNNRQKVIAELIASNDISTQEELMDRLTARGFEVAQATVSRDLHQLRVTKIPLGHGRYRYSLPAEETAAPLHFNSAYIDSIRSVDSAMNIVVLRTFTGLAQAVATGLDAIDNEEILGCVAGDDTIMLVARTPEAAARIGNSIKEMLARV